MMNLFFTLIIWFCYFVFYSFIGWACETVFCSIAQKHFVNRGFLTGPFCPIYGFGAVFVLLLFSRYADDLLALFLLSIVVTSALEYAASFLLEKMFKLSLWDYSGRKWNVNGRVCLRNSLMFGVLSVLMVRVIHPFFEGWLITWPMGVTIAVFGVLVLYFLTDLFISVRALIEINHELADRQMDLPKLTRLRNEYVKSLRAQNRRKSQLRLYKAFPNMQSGRYQEMLEAIQEAVAEKKEAVTEKMESLKKRDRGAEE